MAHYPGITDSHTDIKLWAHMMWERKPAMSVILHAVYKCESADEWQAIRLRMKGMPLEGRFELCQERFNGALTCDAQGRHETAREMRLQVANYIDALKRGGMIK